MLSTVFHKILNLQKNTSKEKSSTFDHCVSTKCSAVIQYSIWHHFSACALQNRYLLKSILWSNEFEWCRMNTVNQMFLVLHFNKEQALKLTNRSIEPITVPKVIELHNNWCFFQSTAFHVSPYFPPIPEALCVFQLNVHKYRNNY